MKGFGINYGPKSTQFKKDKTENAENRFMQNAVKSLQIK